MRVRDYVVDVCMCLARAVGDGKSMPPLPYVTRSHFNSRKVQNKPLHIMFHKFILFYTGKLLLRERLFTSYDVYINMANDFLQMQ